MVNKDFHNERTVLSHAHAAVLMIGTSYKLWITCMTYRLFEGFDLF